MGGILTFMINYATYKLGLSLGFLNCEKHYKIVYLLSHGMYHFNYCILKKKYVKRLHPPILSLE